MVSWVDGLVTAVAPSGEVEEENPESFWGF